jgi:hypothetical protein
MHTMDCMRWCLYYLVIGFDWVHDRAEGLPLLHAWMGEVSHLVLRPLIHLLWGED